jgi:hypothetical protein
MTHICRSPAGANGWASGDTYSNHQTSRNSVSINKNQSDAIAYGDPPRQKAASFNLDEVMRTMTESGAK